METSGHYLLNEHDIYEIGELCDCLALALEKLTRSRKIYTENGQQHPAVTGFKKYAASIVAPSNLPVDDIF
jgi:hypothetical protein